ncbi:hypothetical protein B9K00_13265, partial [Staphylococcus caprae]
HRTSELVHFATRTDAAAHIFSSKTPGADFAALADDVAQTMRADGLEPPIALDAALPVTPLSEAELAEP